MIECIGQLWSVKKDHQGEVKLVLLISQTQAQEVIHIPELTQLKITIEEVQEQLNTKTRQDMLRDSKKPRLLRKVSQDDNASSVSYIFKDIPKREMGYRAEYIMFMC